MIEKIGGRDRDSNPRPPACKAGWEKTLNALSGVAYTETDKILALLNVPKLYRITGQRIIPPYGNA
jgi:hypothetical protein